MNQIDETTKKNGDDDCCLLNWSRYNKKPLIIMLKVSTNQPLTITNYNKILQLLCEQLLWKPLIDDHIAVSVWFDWWWSWWWDRIGRNETGSFTILLFWFRQVMPCIFHSNDEATIQILNYISREKDLQGPTSITQSDESDEAIGIDEALNNLTLCIGYISI